MLCTLFELFRIKSEGKVVKMAAPCYTHSIRVGFLQQNLRPINGHWVQIQINNGWEIWLIPCPGETTLRKRATGSMAATEAWEK